MIGVVAIATGAAAADTYPSRPIHLIVPWPPGGAADISARQIAERLSRALGQSVVVENRPGASGAVGLAIAAKAAPDGYTVVFGGVNDLALAPAFNANLAYEPLRDFAPITQLWAAPHVLACSPELGVRTMREFVALAQSKPGEIRYATAGTATMSHVAGEALSRSLGLRLLHVPYKGGSLALNAVVSGEVQMAMQFPAMIVPLADGGRVRPLMVMGPRRIAVLPGVPSAIEAGYPGLEFALWTGLLLPAKTPPSIVQRLHDETVRILKSPEIVQSYANSGTQAVGSSPEEFAAFIKAEQVKWAKVITETGIKSE